MELVTRVTVGGVMGYGAWYTVKNYGTLPGFGVTLMFVVLDGLYDANYIKIPCYGDSEEMKNDLSGFAGYVVGSVIGYI